MPESELPTESAPTLSDPIEEAKSNNAMSKAIKREEETVNRMELIGNFFRRFGEIPQKKKEPEAPEA